MKAEKKKQVIYRKKNVKSKLSNDVEEHESTMPKRKRGRPKKTEVSNDIENELKTKEMYFIDCENKNDSIEIHETIVIDESDDEIIKSTPESNKSINFISLEKSNKDIGKNENDLNEKIETPITPNRKNMITQTDDYLQNTSKMNEKNMIDKRFTYFTGFTKKRFDVLIECLQIKSTQFDEYLSVRDQVTLTLTKYKHSLEIIMLSELYGIRSKIVFQIFIHWTKELYKYFSSIDIWDLKHKPDFKYTAIIDCIELPTEPSKTNQEKNKELYSYEKNTFSLKYVLAVDEKNFVTFCSQVYGGSQDNRSIIMDSNFLNKLSDGDFILTDRDFDISDIWATRNITVEVCDSEKMLFPFEISEIESQSQHFVEQIKTLTKKQKILSETVPNYLLPIINEIVFNVNMLSNFNNSYLEF